MQNYQVDQLEPLSGFGTDLHHQYGISQGKSQTLSRANTLNGREQ